MTPATLAYVTIAVAIVFDVINGFHDAANSIATVVSTRVLSPRLAVLWATVFNFVALFIFGEGVAHTIEKIVHIDANAPNHAFVWVVAAGLVGAIAWNLLTWGWGLPSSSSHALIGGLSGAGIAYGGLGVLDHASLVPTLYFIVLAPIIGLILGGIVMFALMWLFRRVRPRKVDRTFRVAQLFSAAAYSIGHGGNDAQKTIGVIWAVMIAGGLPVSTTAVPPWVIIASYSAMAFGTLIGGRRIIKTLGMGITSLKPHGGFAANLAGAVTLFGATHFHIPVSTTHTITGAIVGVGSVEKVRGIRWGLATRIVWAWIFTIPAAGAVGAVVLLVVHALGAY